MDSSLQQAIDNLSSKLNRLTEHCANLTRQCAQLEQENEALLDVVSRQSTEIAALRNDKEFLIVSHKLAQSPDEIVKARRQIAGWIRDIDKCLSQLKE